MDIINYLTMPQLQSAGTIIFLLALALILGASLMALVSEIKYKPNAKTSYPVISYNITRSALIWIILFAILGGTTIFLPLLPSFKKPCSLLIFATCSGLALLFFLLSHFTIKVLRKKFLHAPLALFAAGSALGAAIFWYLPQTCTAWFQAEGHLATSKEIFFWWLGRNEIAYFLHFFLNSLGVAALLFMLANAAEKEKKRKQSRDYYFQAARFSGRWLLTAATMQILPLGWIFYNQAAINSTLLFTSPGVYWFSGILTTALSGWLLLIKITKDGLVNRRATIIIALFFIFSLSLFHFGPLRPTNSASTSPTQSQTK